MNLEINGGNLLLPIVLSLAGLSSFGWALRGHFLVIGHIPKGMRLLSIASLLSYSTYIGFLLWRGCEAEVWTTLGLVGFALSISLFWWTVTKTRSRRLRLAYTDADPDAINTDGPYAYVRHPFYVSYIGFWLSTALIAGTWQWAAAVALTLWYVSIARREETRFRSSGLSLAYEIYRQRTGMLLPRVPLAVREPRQGQKR